MINIPKSQSTLDIFKKEISRHDIRAFIEGINSTRSCLSNHPDTDPIKCETAVLSSGNLFTYHTHPNGTPFPSDVDIKTTKRMGKRFLIIGLVPTNEIIIFSAIDGFHKPILKVPAKSLL